MRLSVVSLVDDQSRVTLLLTSDEIIQLERLRSLAAEAPWHHSRSFGTENEFIGTRQPCSSECRVCGVDGVPSVRDAYLELPGGLSLTSQLLSQPEGQEIARPHVPRVIMEFANRFSGQLPSLPTPRNNSSQSFGGDHLSLIPSAISSDLLPAPSVEKNAAGDELLSEDVLLKLKLEDHDSIGHHSTFLHETPIPGTSGIGTPSHGTPISRSPSHPTTSALAFGIPVQADKSRAHCSNGPNFSNGSNGPNNSNGPNVSNGPNGPNGPNVPNCPNVYKSKNWPQRRENFSSNRREPRRRPPVPSEDDSVCIPQINQYRTPDAANRYKFRNSADDPPSPSEPDDMHTATSPFSAPNRCPSGCLGRRRKDMELYVPPAGRADDHTSADRRPSDEATDSSGVLSSHNSEELMMANRSSSSGQRRRLDEGKSPKDGGPAKICEPRRAGGVRIFASALQSIVNR